MRRLRLGDKVLRVRDEPEPPPRGPVPLVCIHGAGSSSVTFMDLIRRFQGGRRIVAPDLPGHGQSDRWHETVSLDGYRDATGTVCARLGLQRVLLLGHSMGAAVALRCALAWPERVAGLILVAGGGVLSVDPGVMELLRACLPPGDDTWVDRMPEAMARLSFSPETPAEVRARWQAVLWAAPRSVVLADFAACDGFDVRDALGTLRLPVLLVGGSDDLLVPPHLLQETAARIPGAQLVLLPRAAHLPHLEAPEAFSAALDEFLQAQK